ncbi:DeoR/GlpR transcriptional regulator [Gluconacetobacter tumulisoli]|uniref:DeoR/GlpR transcriptional regulator n=1 Tax=Gluconacetobacter tumulisoli TaxID=1286189 RepID=A0A7W4KA24_9PROT|nr:DeoR/GlpR transcriptional regulator [Gluconacetobacter tumulisoli]MBB2203057.1 DeoR/GlpR transcriptional regulator [Gluconacetobacter tumulisoli]
MGTSCLDQLDNLHADHAGLGIGAISESGELTDHDPQEAQFGQAMIVRTHRTTVLAVSTTFDNSALTKPCGFTDANGIASGNFPPEEFRRLADRHDVDLLAAS